MYNIISACRDRRHDYAQEGVQLLAVEGAIVGLPAVRGVAGLEVQVTSKPLVAMLLAQSRVQTIQRLSQGPWPARA